MINLFVSMKILGTEVFSTDGRQPKAQEFFGPKLFPLGVVTAIVSSECLIIVWKYIKSQSNENITKMISQPCQCGFIMFYNYIS